MKPARPSFGIGVDLEKIARFKDRSRNDPVLRRIFTDRELDYCFVKEDPSQHLAARFAGKEAVVKALTDMGVAAPTVLDYVRIEFFLMPDGRPVARYRAGEHPVEIHVSLTHAGGFAMAFAFVEQSKPNNYEQER